MNKVHNKKGFKTKGIKLNGIYNHNKQKPRIWSPEENNFKI